MNNDKKKELLESILTDLSNLSYDVSGIKSIKSRAAMIVAKVFDEDSGYISQINGIRFEPVYLRSDTNSLVRVAKFNDGRQKFIDLIKLIIEDFELTNLSFPTETNKPIKMIDNKSDKIFIVHGHNEEMKQSVARFVEKTNYGPIILHEQASQGKTIIEKFAIHSDVSFAIVLLSADDIGTNKTGDLKNAKLRARQNVIFELGFFLGKLGRERVIVLHQVVDNFEFPSDYQGVLYIPFDNNGYWRFEIIKEMKALGYQVDANHLL